MIAPVDRGEHERLAGGMGGMIFYLKKKKAGLRPPSCKGIKWFDLGGLVVFAPLEYHGQYEAYDKQDGRDVERLSLEFGED